MLKIQNLTVQINQQAILKNLSLALQPGSVHALMGPNGSGKSTLAYALMGHPSCQITAGNILFHGRDITDLALDQRARLGLFLAFQYPQTVPGLKIFNFLKAAYEAFGSAVLAAPNLNPDELVAISSEPAAGGAQFRPTIIAPSLGDHAAGTSAQSVQQRPKNLSVSEFKLILDDAVNTLGLNPELVTRDLNDGFSGGEKKRLEMLQLYLLRPKLAIIDEIDSGLDVDALKTVTQVLQACRARDPEFTLLLVTHYRRILDYLTPDFVHVVADGQIVAAGPASLAQQIDQTGYAQYREL